MTPEERLAKLQLLKDLIEKRDALQRPAPKMLGADPVTGMPIFEDPQAQKEALRGSNEAAVEAGRGALRYGKGLVNIALPDAITPNFASDAALTAEDEKVKSMDPALQQARNIGGLYGGMATPFGSALKVLGSAGKAAPYIARILKAAQGPVGQGAIVGGTTGAAMATPGQQGSQGLSGAALGAGLGLALPSLARLGTGLIQKSPEAEILQTIARQHGDELFVPAGQAADPRGDMATRAGRVFYREVSPIIPGVSGMVEKQSRQAMDAVRRYAAMDADVNNVLRPDMTPVERTAALRAANDAAYQNTIKAYAFNKPSTFRDDILKRIRAANPNVPDAIANKVATDIDMRMELHSSGQPVITGDNLWNARNEVSQLFGEYSNAEQQALKAGMGEFDDLIARELTAGNSRTNISDLRKFLAQRTNYENLKAVEDATASAVNRGANGEFTPAELARAANPNTQPSTLANAAGTVLGRPAQNPSMAGRSLGYALGGLGAGSGHVLGTAATVGVGAGLNSVPAQRFAMGEFASQRALADALRKLPPETAQRFRNLLTIEEETYGSR